MDHVIPILPILAVVAFVASLGLVMLKSVDRLPFGWRRVAEIVVILIGPGALSFWAVLRYGTWE
jgi:hypothetical protein